MHRVCHFFCRMHRHICCTDGSDPDSCGPLSDYYIPHYILNPESKQISVDNPPCCPVVVFINSRSGGQMGSSLIKTYRELLNTAQVYRLGNFQTLQYAFSCTIVTFTLVSIVGATQGFRSLRRASGQGSAQNILQL
jgi:hypothetical protein